MNPFVETFVKVHRESLGSPLADPVRRRHVLPQGALLVRECLAGIVTSLALIPEVISFSFVAGVEPTVSLVASGVLGLTMSALGGRPAMVTAAAGSVALVLGPMVRAHGVSYVLPTVLVAGVLQIAFGLAGLHKMMCWVPRPVMTGFVNALGALIFLAQVPHVTNQPPVVYGLFALTLVIVQCLPRFTKAVPSPLIAVAVVTALATAGHLQVPSVGGSGTLVSGLPGVTPLAVPLSLATARIVGPVAFSVALVGLLESLLTARLVDDVTGTASDHARESWALGIANIGAGIYGGIAGCAMIAQTVVNVQIGRARTRVSTAVAALVLLLLVTTLNPVLAKIPMVALAAVMMVVALKTFDWRSLRPTTLGRMPVAETSVMVCTLVATVWTGNLAIGVGLGVILAVACFARAVARDARVLRMLRHEKGEVHYQAYGTVFFGNSSELAECFRYGDDPPVVAIDLSHARILDPSGVAALNSIEERYRKHGSAVRFDGLDPTRGDLYARLAGRVGSVS